MANTPEVTGLLAELGLGPFNEQAARDAGRQQTPDVGSGQLATQYQMGYHSGQAIGGGIGALGAGVAGMFSRGGQPKQGFREATKQFVKDNNAAMEARGLGMDVETYKARKSVRGDLKSIQIAPTGDGLADQQAYLKEVIAIANRYGDTEVLTKAMQKQAALKTQALAMSEVEGTNKARTTETDAQIWKQGVLEGTAIPVIPKGADPKADGFRPSTATYNPVTDKFTQVSANGKDTEEVDDINPYYAYLDATKVSGSGIAPRFTTALDEAIRLSGGGKTFAAKNSGLEDMWANVENLNGITDLFLAFPDASTIVSMSGSSAIAAEKAITLAEQASRMFTGKNVGNGTYRDKYSNREIKDDLYAYNGKIVSREEQHNAFLEAGAGMLDKIQIPPYLRAQLAEVANGSSLYKAMIMEMAYMDARMQEPSNRGLSDKDIEAALERIGAFSANPLTFLDRQIQLTGQRRAKMDRLGTEYPDSPSLFNSRRELTDVTYPSDKVETVKFALDESLVSMQEAREKIRVAQGRYMAGDTGTETTQPDTRDPLLDMTQAEMEAELAAMDEAEKAK